MISSIILPWVIPSILVAVSLYLAPEIEKYLQTNADNIRREYLHEAIMNAILTAKLENPVANDEYVVKDVIGYLKATVPDAIKELKLKDKGLRLLIQSHLYMFGSEREEMIAEDDNLLS